MQPKVEARNDREPSSRNFQSSVPSTPLLPKEWSRVKEEYGRIQGFEEVMMAKLISGERHIDVARSLLTFAGKESCGISYKLLLRYLALCVKQDQVTEIYDVYDLMKAKFKSFDTGAYSLFIKGFSQTDRWREAIALLETIKKTVSPSSGNYRDCIKGAVEHGEEQLALKLYKEMLQSELTPCDDTIRSLFNAGGRVHTKSFKNELLCILDYLRDNQIYPGEPLMESIKSWFESIPNESWTGQASSATHNGHCQACGQQLESIHLKPEEYDVLKDVFLNSVIKGPDTFRKTTPQELQDFQEFVNSRPPYDIVVDGLNVAHISPKGVRSQNLLDVVSSLASGGSRVLVLGRRHMLQDSRVWQRRHLDLLQQRADCFFLHNTSEDDPFLLYASLYSGNHCYFLTRDLMRDHKASLPDPQTRRLFFKWQRGHQLIIPFYAPGSKVYLQPTRCYDTILQSTDLSWHVPYDKMGVTRATFEVPETWLCLQKKL
ncbi:mitochondrial ribonuclease P catalytic subunit isoform X2 [Spea bombifrons]|nr:mitochondrial ribonuclease P catalytic subunit isoform X2 [Spea bombifrons]